MPIGKVPKVTIGKNSELSQYFLEDDPEAIFLDQREIGHGSFGAVYYVSQCIKPSSLCMHTYIHVHVRLVCTM